MKRGEINKRMNQPLQTPSRVATQKPATPANSRQFLQKFLQIPVFFCGGRNFYIQ